MKLLAFAASHRRESMNRKLARLAADFAEKQKAQVDFVEYSTFDMPIYDDEVARDQVFPEPAQRFVDHLAKCDGLIIASPEYNWSFPGSLKNIIDWASAAKPSPFAGKTALLLSASPSLRGGAQGLVQLKEPLQHLGVFVYPQLFALSLAGDAFDGKAAFRDAKLADELSQIIVGFTGMTAALKAA